MTSEITMGFYNFLELAVAVIVAVILLATAVVLLDTLKVLRHQLRVANQQLKLQNYMEYTKRYQKIILNFPENINEDNFNMGYISPKKRNKTMRYMRAYYDLCSEEFDLKSKGYIDTKMWQSWKDGMEFAFSKEAFQQAWGKIKTDTRYSKSFIRFVECAMKRQKKKQV